MSSNSSSTDAPMLTLTPALETFLHSFAWVYWGLIFSTILLGVTFLQTWIYARHNNDGWMLRSVVTFVVCLDVATTFLIAAGGDYYWIRSFGNVPALEVMPHTLSSETVITVLVTFIVQIFFTSQIYIVSKKNWLWVGPSAFFAFAAFGIGFALSADIFLNTSIAAQEKGSTLYYYIVVGQTMDVCADLVATFGMSWTLMRQRTGMIRTDSLIKNLLTYIINRGILVTVCQFLFMILFATNPGQHQWIFFHFQLSKLYTNTMLAILNARSSLRNANPQAKDGTMGSIHTGAWPLSPTTITGTRSFQVRSSMKPPTGTSFPGSGVMVQSHEESFVDLEVRKPGSLSSLSA